MSDIQGSTNMSSSQRTVMWIVFGVLLVVAIAFSAREKGIREGAQGSYLGREVRQAQPAPAGDALANRANSGQRY
jgi:hypothetical protein